MECEVNITSQEVLVLLYIPIVKLCLEYCVQFCKPYFISDVDRMEQSDKDDWGAGDQAL